MTAPEHDDDHDVSVSAEETPGDGAELSTDEDAQRDDLTVEPSSS